MFENLQDDDEKVLGVWKTYKKLKLFIILKVLEGQEGIGSSKRQWWPRARKMRKLRVFEIQDIIKAQTKRAKYLKTLEEDDEKVVGILNTRNYNT